MLRLVAAGLTNAEVADRLGRLIGLRPAPVTSEDAVWAVRRFLEVLADRQPLVVVVDDLHWAKPALLDLLEQVAALAREARLLLVAVARPELLEQRPGWSGGRLNASTMLLEPLAAEESATLLEHLAGEAPLPADATDRITSTAEGNPLFLEELLAALVEEGRLRRQDGRWVAADLDDLGIPPSIQALLTARLDRLDPIAHAKNLISVEQLQNLLMSIVKACAIFGVVTFVCLLSINSLVHMSGTSLMLAATTTLDVAVKCERLALLLLIALVTLDWVIKKRSHTEQLKMTREDVDREQKDAFGDRHTRAGRNEFRNDLLAGQLTENTRKANAVVTNPTHFAVALLYDPEQYPLPVVLARGTGRDAQVIRHAARANGIPLIRSVQLARALYSTGRNGRAVPRVTLKAVAAVYRVVAEIKAGERQLDDYIELFDEVDADRAP